METSDHVLVVDDDAEIRRLLGDYLRKNGYRATTVGDGNAMWAALARGKVDLIVLDLMLPGQDGLSLCRKLRAESDTPVIMLTARGEETDRVVGLEMGADDYLAKPFHPRELLARIRAIIARAGGPDLPPPAPGYRFGGRSLDMIRRTLVLEDGNTVVLSGAEFELLAIFVARPNRVLSRDLLVELTQGREAPAYDRSIDVRVSRLRQAMADHSEPRLLRTVYGEGYILSTKVEPLQ